MPEDADLSIYGVPGKLSLEEFKAKQGNREGRVRADLSRERPFRHTHYLRYSEIQDSTR